MDALIRCLPPHNIPFRQHLLDSFFRPLPCHPKTDLLVSALLVAFASEKIPRLKITNELITKSNIYPYLNGSLITHVTVSEPILILGGFNMVLARVFSWLSFFERVAVLFSRAHLVPVPCVSLPVVCFVPKSFDAICSAPQWAGRWNTENGAGLCVPECLF